ncbi:g-patch domain-containing protein [Gigaspora margarita]|uniref:G-patch domain-containing protein n=1 Tax=Gigaspora margarita TaxID=4874 RepID=A0A8H4AZT3_GIGMA|nr:g-patch domain-containing protein [Gigaspora margarita]
MALSNDTNSCPAPLIASPIDHTSKTCIGGCCIPCPYINNFYPPGQIDTIYTVLSIVRVISFSCILFIVLSYLVLPNKREQPALIVLFFNMCLLVFLSVTFFYIGDHKAVQCANNFTQSTMENNILCGIQGVLLILSTFLLILFCFLLILHLHIQTVWKSNLLQRYYVHAQVIIWIISLLFTFMPAATKNITFDFGAVCLVSGQISKPMFWFPLACFVIPAFLIHIMTFIHISKAQWTLARDFEDSSLGTIVTSSSATMDNITSQDVLNVIKIQWRSLLLTMIMLFTYSVFMVYSILATNQLSPLLSGLTDPWISEWITCLMNHKLTNDGQSKCAHISLKHVPDAIFLTIAELLTASLGISIFLVFGTSVGLLREWRYWFIKTFGHVEKYDNSRFM